MINTTGLTHPALDKITRITPIICGSRGSGVGFTSSTDQPFWRAPSGTADNAIAPVVSAFGLTSGERPGSHHCPIPRFLPAASPWSGARPADSQITGAWDRGGIVAGLEFAAAAIRARELSRARPVQALCGPHRRSLSPDLAARLLDRLGGIVPLGCGALLAGAPAALPGDTA